MMNKRKPLSLYIHIPFCVRKCLYCDFVSFRKCDEEKEQYLLALFQEMERWKAWIADYYTIQTVFIGGGTPTCLLPEQLCRLGEAIKNYFCLTEQAEYTIEANPGTVTKEHITALKHMGVNRISLGLQSAQNEELKELGRIHSYEDFLQTYELLRQEEFSNINVDLMADIPGQTLQSYRDTLEKVLKLEAEHISSYSLIIEPGTPFYERKEKGLLLIPDEETDREMYRLTQELLLQKGYQRYEISNYAKEGKACRHNLAYWSGTDYLGIGMAASSYLQGMRFTQTAVWDEYLASAEDFEKDKVTEDSFLSVVSSYTDFTHLTKEEKMEEFMFLGLRKMQGISRKEFTKCFGITIESVYGEVLERFFSQNLLAEDKNSDRIYLTNRGIDVSNYVLSEFIL